MYSCGPQPSHAVSLLTTGQLQVQGSLCITSTGKPSTNSFLLETCDTTGTNANQIFEPMCPPAPPPPVAVAPAPCGGGPVAVAQTAANGQQLCMTNPTGFQLLMQPCSTGAPNQLWSGWGTDRVAVLGPNANYCITANSFQPTIGNDALAYPCSGNVAGQTYLINAMGQIEVGSPSTGVCLSSTGSPSPSNYQVRNNKQGGKAGRALAAPAPPPSSLAPLCMPLGRDDGAPILDSPHCGPVMMSVVCDAESCHRSCCCLFSAVRLRKMRLHSAISSLRLRLPALAAAASGHHDSAVQQRARHVDADQCCWPADVHDCRQRLQPQPRSLHHRHVPALVWVEH